MLTEALKFKKRKKKSVGQSRGGVYGGEQAQNCTRVGSNTPISPHEPYSQCSEEEKQRCGLLLDSDEAPTCEAS